jgi:hypothetical protein
VAYEIWNTPHPRRGPYFEDARFVFVEKVVFNPRQLFTHSNFELGMRIVKPLNFDAQSTNRFGKEVRRFSPGTDHDNKWQIALHIVAFMKMPPIEVPLPGYGKHYEKRGCFAIGLRTQFLNCIGHLQFTIFIRYECYQISCKNYKSCNSPYIWCNSLQFC